MSKSDKGGKFERETCRLLSMWFSEGRRDDMFWRSAGSGAMATVRGRQGKLTSGQYGDVSATDEEGQALLDVVTIELKRGYSKHTVQDTLDKLPTAAVQKWEEHCVQAMSDHELAGTFAWLLIHRRDRRAALVYMPVRLFKALREVGALRGKSLPSCRLSTSMRIADSVVPVSVFCMTLDNFMSEVAPSHILEILRKLTN